MIQFLLPVLFLVLSYNFDVAGGVGDPCVGYKVETDETRSARYNTDIDNDLLLCDTNIDENRWYRFEVLTPYRLHDRCVTGLKCGTERPIWVNGTHPTALDPGPKSLSACSYDTITNDCCGGWKATISSKYCIATTSDEEDFFVYQLKKPPNCYMAYCAGDALVCKKGTVFNPNSNTCTTPCPKLTGADFQGPVSVLRVTQSGQPYDDFFFACNIKWSNPDTLNKGEQFEVVFTFNGQAVTSMAPKITDGSKLNVRLWSNEFMGQIGKRVGCKVLPYWKGVKKTPCKYLQANATYFVGFNYSTDNTEGSFTNPPIVIDEKSPPLTLYFKPTVPISCPERSQDSCSVSIIMADFPKDDQLGVSRCNMNFGGLQTGKKLHTLYIKARTTPGTHQRSSVIRFNPIITYNEFFWSNYTLPNVPVTIKDSSVTAKCSSVGDPHITTFDSTLYHVYTEGDFILAKSTQRNFEVHVRHHKCWAVACNCGVAVREGNNVMGVNACQGPNYSPTPITYLIDPNVPGATITRNGNEYKITMPSGAYVTMVWDSVYLSNVYVYVNSEDFGKTSGLCGTYNNDISDETTPNANVNKYRLNPEESFLNGHIYPIKCLNTTQIPICSCENGRPVACEGSNIDPNTLTDTFETKFTQICGEEKKQLETETQNETNTEGRITRKLIITEDDIPLPEVDENHGVNVTLRWPTASGITEVEAKRKCLAKMKSSPVYQLCKDRITSNMEAIITSCVTDLQITDDVNVATSGIISDFQAVCVHKVENSVVSNGSSIPTQEEILLANVVSMICPSQCNGNGNCSNGTCACNDGFAGEDCSINATQPPRLSSFRKGPLCDFRTSVCSYTSIFATNFYRSLNLACRVTAVDGSKQFHYPASVLSPEEVICPLPDVNSILDQEPKNGTKPPLEVGPAPFYRWNVSLTSDGKLYSNSLRLTVYDSKCQECCSEGICTLKPETCVNEGRCYLSDSAACACGFDRVSSSLQELDYHWEEFKKEVIRKLVPQ